MQLFMDSSPPGIGLQFTSLKGIPMMNRTGGATAIGQLIFVDMVGADAAVTSLAPGNAAYPLANFIAPGAGGIAGTSFGIYGVATEVSADDAQCKVDIYGRMFALSRHTTGATVSVGMAAVPDAGFLDFDPADAGPLIATYHDADAALSATSALKEVFLNGFYAMFNASR